MQEITPLKPPTVQENPLYIKDDHQNEVVNGSEQNKILGINSSEIKKQPEEASYLYENQHLTQNTMDSVPIPTDPDLKQSDEQHPKTEPEFKKINSKTNKSNSYKTDTIPK